MKFLKKLSNAQNANHRFIFEASDGSGPNPHELFDFEFSEHVETKEETGHWEAHALRANTYDEATAKGSVDLLGQAADTSVLFKKHVTYVLGLASHNNPDFIGYNVLKETTDRPEARLDQLIIKMGQLVDYCLQREAKDKASAKSGGLIIVV